MRSLRDTRSLRIRAVQGGSGETRSDVVAVEEPLEIRICFEQDGQTIERGLSITMRTPGDEFELVAGFLLSENLVSDHNQIERMSINDKDQRNCNVVRVRLSRETPVDLDRLVRHFYTTSSCGVCGKASIEALEISNYPILPSRQPVVDAAVIHTLGQELRSGQSVFKETGGLHAAALFDAAGLFISLHEDVGRHNAVDKLLGEQYLLEETPLLERIMMVSGRASFEIMQKALMAGIPIVAAVGAPSTLAVDMAREFGMTLLGFVRDDRFNIYAGRQRIRESDPRA